MSLYYETGEDTGSCADLISAEIAEKAQLRVVFSIRRATEYLGEDVPRDVRGEVAKNVGENCVASVLEIDAELEDLQAKIAILQERVGTLKVTREFVQAAASNTLWAATNIIHRSETAEL